MFNFCNLSLQVYKYTYLSRQIMTSIIKTEISSIANISSSLCTGAHDAFR